jgi:stress-induced morphogen
MTGAFGRIRSHLVAMFDSPRLLPSFLAKWNGTDAAARSAVEMQLIQKLKERIPEAKEVDVVDISHGCGDMYEVHVISSHFKGKSLVQQHRLIQTAIGEDIRSWHGLRISTSTE